MTISLQGEEVTEGKPTSTEKSEKKDPKLAQSTPTSDLEEPRRSRDGDMELNDDNDNVKLKISEKRSSNIDTATVTAKKSTKSSLSSDYPGSDQSGIHNQEQQQALFRRHVGTICYVSGTD